MSDKIKFFKDKKDVYVHEVSSQEGFLESSEEHSNKDLGDVMKRLSLESEPDNAELLLRMLRHSYKLFDVCSIEFIQR